MSEIKQADPSSILLPLSQYATPTEEKKKCKWINEKGSRPGELCGQTCGFSSDKYCSAHVLVAERREAQGCPASSSTEIKYHSGPPRVNWAQNAESKEPTDDESVQDRYEMVEELGVPEELVLTPQEIQTNTERLLKLQLLDSMMKLLQIAFKN